MDFYTYTPLDQSKKTMHVLQLLGSYNFTDPMQCKLIKTILGEFPYEAVLYTWGSTLKPSSIMTNEYIMTITKTALTLLRHLYLFIFKPRMA